MVCMLKYNLDISDDSTWITATPSSVATSLPFYLTEVGKFYAGKGYYTERSDKDSYLILYTISGRGSITVDGNEIDIYAHNAVFINCNSHQFYKTESDVPWVFLWAHINGTGVEPYYSLVNVGRVSQEKISDYADFVELFEEILITSKFNDVRTLSNLSVNLQRLLSIILKSRLSSSNNKKHESHIADIRSSVDYIRKNYKRQISIDDIIHRINISKYYFIRLFKQYMGTTPYDYLINYRINQAKILLNSTSMPIGDISQEVGFLDESNFISHFKRQTGIKPTEYRNSTLGFHRPPKDTPKEE